MTPPTGKVYLNFNRGLKASFFGIIYAIINITTEKPEPMPDSPYSTEIFEDLVESSSMAHGHLCAGQVVGVRMALLGCRLVGLIPPLDNRDIKKLIIWVEMDRCTADAVAHTSGVKLGRRSLKFKDYGIMAATFHNLETGAAFRVISTEEARDLIQLYAPELAGEKGQAVIGYKRMPEAVLFRVQQVEIDLDESDLPGPTRSKATCAKCGQVVRDGREVTRDGQTLCLPCAEGAYFKDPREINWEGMESAPV